MTLKKKILLLVVFVMSLSLFLFGCGEKSNVKVEVQSPEEAARMEGDPIQNLAIKEKEWLGRLDAVREDIKNSYTAWEQEKATKEEFIQQLDGSMDQVKGIKKDYDLHMEVNPFPADKENEEVYKDGLAYGKKLRTNVNNFIFMVTDGIMDAETNKLKPLTDEQIKDLYQNYMVEKYDQYKSKLEPALESAK